jgi:hypothetical protein
MAIEDGAQKLAAYCQVLCDANNALSSGQNPPADPPPLDVAAYRLMFRNIILAGSADKLAFMGGLTQAPTVTAATLTGLGFTVSTANAIIAERDRIRAAALALVS